MLTWCEFGVLERCFAWVLTRCEFGVDFFCLACVDTVWELGVATAVAHSEDANPKVHNLVFSRVIGVNLAGSGGNAIVAFAGCGVRGAGV